MSVRTIQSWKILTLSLGALAASACGSDDKKDTTKNDAGDGKDATVSTSDSGAADAATSGPKSELCKGKTEACEGTLLEIAPGAAGIPVDGCCTDDNACGIIVPAGGPLAGQCVEKNQPGKASAFCTGALVQLQAAQNAADGGTGTDAGTGASDAGATGDAAVEGDAGAGPGGYVVSINNIKLVYPGCCVPKSGGTGECGLYSDKSTIGGAAIGKQLGLGCLPIDALSDAFPGGKVPDEARVACEP